MKRRGAKNGRFWAPAFTLAPPGGAPSDPLINVFPGGDLFPDLQYQKRSKSVPGGSGQGPRRGSFWGVFWGVPRAARARGGLRPALRPSPPKAPTPGVVVDYLMSFIK